MLRYDSYTIVKDQKRVQLQYIPKGIPRIFYPQLVNEPPSIHHTQRHKYIARYGYGTAAKASFTFFFLFIFLSTLLGFLTSAAKLL
jgi:hypothetical protein